VLGSAGGVLGRLYPAAGQYARSVWWGVVSRLLVTGALAAAALAGAGIFEAVLASSSVTLIYVVFLWRDLRKRFSELYPFWQGARLQDATKNIAHSVVLTGCALLVQLQQHGIIFVLSGHVGLAVIPAYTTTRTLANVFTQAASIVTGPLMPEMVRFSATKQHDKLADTVRAIWFVTGVPVNFGLCLGLPLYEVLYTAWTRGEMPFDGALFALLAAAISVRCIGAPLNALMAGLNALRAQVWINAAQSAVVLGALLLAAPHWGVRAAGAAVALGEIVGSVVVPVMLMWRIEPEAMRRLPVRSLLVVIAPSTLVASILLAVAAGLLPPITAAAGGVVLLTLLYRLQWSGLALQVRARLLALIRLRRGPSPVAES
jgi:O-antigen/teichoic acid export membrane protein